jgi:tRNA pseudouridine55 synthase
MTKLQGVLVVDKPKGPTSHDVVQRLRKALGTREIGHAGTLDPMATGVLVVTIGEATKLVPYLTASDKEYEATVRFGIATDTLDAEGEETARAEIPEDLARALSETRHDFVPELLRRAIDAEVLRTSQVPPAYSAIKRDGEAAHVVARRGEQPALEPRPVAVRQLIVLEACADPPTVSVLLEVGKGYYVRSFARDLAARLGTVGHLVALRRTASGPFTLDEAISSEAGEAALRERLIPMARAASRVLGSFTLDERATRDARHGKLLDAETMRDHGDGPRAWLAPDGSLVAIGERAPDGRGRVLRGFR